MLSNTPPIWTVANSESRSARTARFVRLLAVCVGLLVQPSPARADTDAAAAADALFRAGRAAAASGDDRLACRRFRESQRLQPAPGTLLNLGICEERLGALVAAWQHYHAALDALPSTDTRRQIALQRLSELDPRVPRFVLRKAAGAPRRVSVSMDGVAFNESSFDVGIPVDPGSHSWIASAPDHERRTYVHTIAEGERYVLEIETGPLVRASRVTGRARSRGARLRRPVGYGLIAAGAASLVVSGLTALLARDRASTVDEECMGNECSRSGVRAADQGGGFVRLCTLSFTWGLLTAASGAYLVFDP